MPDIEASGSANRAGGARYSPWDPGDASCNWTGLPLMKTIPQQKNARKVELNHSLVTMVGMGHYHEQMVKDGLDNAPSEKNG